MNVDQERKTVPVIRSSKLLWLPVFAGGVAAVALLGTPHLLWEYRYTGPRSAPYFVSCDYIGWHSQRVRPSNRKCPYVQLLKPGQRR